jgi:hypothetical protein
MAAKRKRARLKKAEVDHFRSLVRKAGGAVKAAAIIGCVKETVTNHSGGLPTISLAGLRKLERAVGVNVSPTTVPTSMRGEMVVLSVEELAALEVRRYSDYKDGFQRKINASRVAQIEIGLRAGKGQHPPITVGQFPDGSRTIIDGQHRAAGHSAAGVPCETWIIQVADLEAARELYLTYNGKARPINARDRFEASRNPLSGSMREYQEVYGVTYEQITAVFAGVLGSKGMDFIDPKRGVEEEVLVRVQLILEHWTNDVRFSSEAGAGCYDHPKVFWAWGKVSRELSLDHLELALMIVSECRHAFYKNGTLDKMIKSKKPRKQVTEWIRRCYTPKMLGGFIGKKANRS